MTLYRAPDFIVYIYMLLLHRHTTSLLCVHEYLLSLSIRCCSDLFNPNLILPKLAINTEEEGSFLIAAMSV